MIRQVLGDEAGTKGPCGRAMQPDGGGGGLETAHALSKQAAGQARQNIAGAGRRQPGRQIMSDGGPPIGMGHDRVGAFQEYRPIHAGGSVSGSLQLRMKWSFIFVFGL